MSRERPGDRDDFGPTSSSGSTRKRSAGAGGTEDLAQAGDDPIGVQPHKVLTHLYWQDC